MRTKDLLNAKHMGVVEAIRKVRRIGRNINPHVLTVNGKPRAVLVPWRMMVRLLEEVEAKNGNDPR